MRPEKNRLAPALRRYVISDPTSHIGGLISPPDWHIIELRHTHLVSDNADCLSLQQMIFTY